VDITTLERSCSVARVCTAKYLFLKSFFNFATEKNELRQQVTVRRFSLRSFHLPSSNFTAACETNQMERF
jgi:hypothetical protein